MPVIKKSHPDLILGQKNTFLVYLPYLLNRLEFSAHILTPRRSWGELVPLGCPVNFGLGGSIFGAKNYVFNTLSLEPLGVQCSS